MHIDDEEIKEDNLNIYYFFIDTISKIRFDSDENSDINTFVKNCFKIPNKFRLQDQKEYNRSSDEEKKKQIFGRRRV